MESVAETAVAPQGALNELSSKFQGRTPSNDTSFESQLLSELTFVCLVRIHFLDNSSKVFLVENGTTVKDVILLCLQKIGVLLNPDDSNSSTNNLSTPAILPYFAIYECLNGSTIENDGALDLSAMIVEVVHSWSQNNAHPDAKLLFLIRLFMPCLWGYQFRDVVRIAFLLKPLPRKPSNTSQVAFKLNKPKGMLTLETYFDETGEHLLDPVLMHLQFIQAVYNIISGRYPTSPDQAIELGAIHFLYKFGEYKPTSHIPGTAGVPAVHARLTAPVRGLRVPRQPHSGVHPHQAPQEHRWRRRPVAGGLGARAAAEGALLCHGRRPSIWRRRRWQRQRLCWL